MDLNCKLEDKKQMKPYQTAWDVAQYMKKYGKRKPININAVTEFFKAGLERELKRITDPYSDNYDILEDIWKWQRELNSWLTCWDTWIYRG